MAYQSPYDQRWQGSGSQFSAPPPMPAGRQQASGTNDLLRLLGGLAPIAGTVAGGAIGLGVGGPAGMMAGAQLGNVAGQGASALANYGGDQVMKPYDEAEAKRQARQQGINNALSALMATRRG